MSRRSVLIMIFLVLALLAYILFNIFDFEKNGIEKSQIILKENFQKEYRGIIKAKYLDNKNHNFETLELELSNDTNYKWIPYGKESYKLYNFIEIGDSIIKENWGYTFKIKRENIDTLININPKN